MHDHDDDNVKKTSLKFIILNSRKQAVINYSGRSGGVSTNVCVCVYIVKVT